VKLLVGLGNPGARYVGSRHNVGFRIAAEFARRHAVALDQDCFHGLYGSGPFRAGAADETSRLDQLAVLLPSTYVNGSGRAVAAALANQPDAGAVGELLVVYDDLDLPLGRLRVRPGGGGGGHNGVASIIDALATRQFARLRFGIGRPPAGSDVVEFVLRRFGHDEERALSEMVTRACDAADLVFAEGPARAMDQFNRAPVAAAAERDG
jgi:PTH1 family peptidyl-tRNA hydrolase